MSTLLRDKLEIKKELVMSGLERRGEGERFLTHECKSLQNTSIRSVTTIDIREVLALSLLHREDKQEILARRADLEAEGVRVKKQMILQSLKICHDWIEMQMILQCLEIFGEQVTEDMADSQVEGWLKLGKLQEQVTEKYPNVQVRSRLSMVSVSTLLSQFSASH